MQNSGHCLITSVSHFATERLSRDYVPFSTISLLSESMVHGFLIQSGPDFGDNDAHDGASWFFLHPPPLLPGPCRSRPCFISSLGTNSYRMPHHSTEPRNTMDYLAHMNWIGHRPGSKLWPWSSAVSSGFPGTGSFSLDILNLIAGTFARRPGHYFHGLHLKS